MNKMLLANKNMISSIDIVNTITYTAYMQ